MFATLKVNLNAMQMGEALKTVRVAVICYTRQDNEDSDMPLTGVALFHTTQMPWEVCVNVLLTLYQCIVNVCIGYLYTNLFNTIDLIA